MEFGPPLDPSNIFFEAETDIPDHPEENTPHSPQIDALSLSSEFSAGHRPILQRSLRPLLHHLSDTETVVNRLRTYQIGRGTTNIPSGPRLPAVVTAPRVVLMVVGELRLRRRVLARLRLAGEELLFQRPLQRRKPTMIDDRDGRRLAHDDGARLHRNRHLGSRKSVSARRRMHFRAEAPPPLLALSYARARRHGPPGSPVTYHRSYFTSTGATLSATLKHSGMHDQCSRTAHVN